MEVEAGLRRLLLADTAVNGYVAGKVWKDRLEDSIDGTGGRAVVVRRVGGWGVPDKTNTQEFPKVRVELWADHARDVDRTILTNDGLTSAYALFRAVDPLLHAKRDVRWGDVIVVSSQRWSEPFEKEQVEFEAACVVVDYAVQLIH